MKVTEEFHITLLDDISEYGNILEHMTMQASECGVTDFTLSPNGRVIQAEVDENEEEQGIRLVIQWLAQSLPFVELIAQVKQIDTYEPVWADDEVEIHVEVDLE